MLIVAVCAAPLNHLAVALWGPVTFADEVPSPVWVIPFGFALVFAAVRLWRFARGRALGLRWTWAVLIVVSSVVVARSVAQGHRVVGWSSVDDAPPAIQTARVMKRVRDQIDAALVAGHDVPSDRSLESALQIDGHMIVLNYRYRFLARRPFRLVRIPDARGPVDRKLPGDLPGTLYLAVSSDARHYWLTGLILLQDNGVRSVDLLPGPAGVLTLTNAG